MPRTARLRLPGHPFHVIQRGNDRTDCFRRREDFVLYLGLLNELSPRFDCGIHAYVLMDNHVHMLVTPGGTDSLSCLMKHLGQRYVQHFNRTHGRTGTLWEGRFRSNVIDSEAYLFRCQRYIELNPVRAGMVLRPEEYPWSSYQANAGCEPSTFLVRHSLYEGLGATPRERASAYRGLFRDSLPAEVLEEIRTAVNGGFVLGGPEFVARIERLVGRRMRPAAGGRPRRAKRSGCVPPDGKPGSVPGLAGDEAREARRRFGDVKGVPALVQLLVGGGEAVEAPQVVGPAAAGEILEEARRTLDVLEESP
jgi:putative transposase